MKLLAPKHDRTVLSLDHPLPRTNLSAKLAGKDVDAAFDHLTAIQHAGGDGYAVRMALAEIAEGKKDKAAYRAALEAAHRFDPSQNEPLKGLFDMAHEPRREARS